LDPTAEDRKKDHIDLAFESVPKAALLDKRFYYEPLLSGHPSEDCLKQEFMGFQFGAPIWVSSMTGGTAKAQTINKNLARACAEYGMGMGLGSCRQLLFSDERLSDFEVKSEMRDQPLFANLGIAQVQELIEADKINLITELAKKLSVDGLFIHINPLQEWFQPEGDRYYMSPIESIKILLDQLDIKVAIKEVGQGMGPESIKALLSLPIAALEFAALGGTNFTQLEIARQAKSEEIDQSFTKVGHTAYEMTLMTNQVLNDLGDKALCKEVIISGGVKNFLDGYYLTNLMDCNAIYGQASGFLKHAMGDFDQLQKHVSQQIEGLRLAKTFLKVKK